MCRAVGGIGDGSQYGVALLPKNDEIVLVAFLSPDQAFVIGSVWSGQNSAPDEAAPVEQRYAIHAYGEQRRVR